jgi:hypothetical protein
VVRTPEEQAEAEAQRKQRQAIGRDAIREADKAQAVITREFNPDDYATDDAMPRLLLWSYFKSAKVL